MTPKLYITVGVPGSGKSTWATANYKLVRVNRDDLRFELFGKYFTGKQEDEVAVSALSDARTKAAIEQGQSVILDNTHLNVKTIESVKRLATALNVPAVHWVDFTTIPVEVCKQRNKARERFVPEAVIDSMYKNIPAAVQKLKSDPFFIECPQ